MNKLVLVFGLFLSLSFSGAANAKVAKAKKQQKPSILQSMDAAPNFSLKDQNGKTHSLKDFKGKIVVLEWFNNECPFVEKHYGTDNMQKLQKKYTKEGVVWLSINSTKPNKAMNPKEAKEIIKKRDSKQTALLLDDDGSVARSYFAKTTPHMFIINPEGKVVYNGAIDDKPSFQKKTVKKARNYISENLDVLLKKKGAKKTIEVSETKPYGCSVKI